MAAPRPPQPPAPSGTGSADSAPSPSTPIPDKLYFKIGEVAQLVGVQPHVLRYWEKEVPSIRPGKSASNQRRYRRRDVETFREIRRLLYEERYTLAGAKKRLLDGPDAANGDGEPNEVSEAAVAAEPVAAVAGGGAQGQLPLGFPSPAVQEKLDAVKSGLRDLIRMAGEEP